MTFGEEKGFSDVFSMIPLISKDKSFYIYLKRKKNIYSSNRINSIRLNHYRFD